MAVISNTSPILALSAIDHLNLLEAQFGEVLIPEAVQAELKTETDFRGAKNIHQALKEGWLKVQAVHNAYLAQALAMETQCQVILLDEHDGRIKARAMGLQPIGVLGILLRAKNDGKLDSLKAAIKSLQSEVGFFVTDDLVQSILRQAGEL